MEIEVAAKKCETAIAHENYKCSKQSALRRRLKLHKKQ